MCAKGGGSKSAILLDLCVSSLRRGHANLLCIVPIFTDDHRSGSYSLHAATSYKCLHWPCLPEPNSAAKDQTYSITNAMTTLRMKCTQHDTRKARRYQRTPAATTYIHIRMKRWDGKLQSRQKDGRSEKNKCESKAKAEPPGGFEPPTFRLRSECSTTEL